VGAIIQTLTLAIVLLIIGLACMVVGAVGLMWKAGRDRRQAEKAANASTSDEHSQLISF
jgi:alpha-D-ribose 1-methylphosphonate 5-triphosphate synthase subunit PhnG